MISLSEHRTLIIQFLKFAVIGLLGFGVDTGMVYLAIHVFGWDRYTSGLFSFPVAASVTWIGNRLFTFRGTHQGAVHHQWAKFLLVSAGGMVLNRGTYSAMVYTFPLVYDYPVLGLLGGTCAGMFFNFFFARRVVFK